MLMLLKRVPSALIRLAVPSSVKSAEYTLCTLPGTLSASMRVPGSGVTPMTDTSGNTGVGVLDDSNAPAIEQPPARDAMNTNTAKTRRGSPAAGLLSWNMENHAAVTQTHAIYSNALQRALDLRSLRRRVESADGAQFHRSSIHQGKRGVVESRRAVRRLVARAGGRRLVSGGGCGSPQRDRHARPCARHHHDQRLARRRIRPLDQSLSRLQSWMRVLLCPSQPRLSRSVAGIGF